MPYAIRVQAGQDEGEVYPLFENREITVGRSPTNNIFIRDRNVSRVHCQVVVTDQGVFLSDLQSTNGTYVNAQRVSETKLSIGDEIRVGTTLLKLQELDQEVRGMTDTAVLD